MKKIDTKDGSESFFNDLVGEGYHSNTGAIEESMEKFVKPALIKDGFCVLDICFGIGYNTLCALHEHSKLSIVGIENDIKIISEIKNVKVKEELSKDYELVKSVSKQIEEKSKTKRNNQLEAESSDNKGNKLKLILGDARQDVRKYSDKFDAVFLDPFSPKKCPEMWTKEFFLDIHNSMKSRGILTTYSCAKIVRDNLKLAGFTVQDGPCVGRRSPSTIGEKK